MAIIPLTKNKQTLVDDDDARMLSQYKWHAAESGDGKFYAARRARGTREMVWMHREICQPKDDEFVDHINGDGLDNRRANLRRCSLAENNRNSGLNRRNTSGYKGVSWHCRRQKWQAGITMNGKKIALGYFDDALAAHNAYCVAADKYHGDFARP